jgi:hypothetical protein
VERRSAACQWQLENGLSVICQRKYLLIGAIATSICVSLVSDGQKRNFIWEDTDSSSQGIRIDNATVTESSKSLAIRVKAFPESFPYRRDRVFSFL